ncbi:MAG: DUF2784 domain-containing protein [Nitrospiraceae bacterium]|nr:DUF2784 domain-containing protein [Nitrospiraceae bacterium]
MSYILLADIVVFVHLLWIIFLFVGAYWGRRNLAVGILHVSGLIFALLIQVFDWYCPLTTLEYYLREKGSLRGAYTGAFITHYVRKLVYLDVSREFIFAATLLLIGVNLWLYLRRPKKRI